MRLWARNNGMSVHELVDLDGSGFDVPPLDWLSGDAPRGVQTGIKALMQAVLEDGMRSYLARDERLRTEAEWWIASSSRRSPFAFAIVCETLSLEPGAVRIALRRLRAKNLPARQAVGRTRPNARRPARLLARKAG